MPRAGPWPQGKREQIRVPYFNFATRPLSAELRASILPGREGCWDTRHDHELVPLRSGGAASVRQHRRAALRRSRGPSRLGEARAEEDVSANRRGRVRGAMVWNDGHDRRRPAALSSPGRERRSASAATMAGASAPARCSGGCWPITFWETCANKDLPLPVSEPDAPAFPALREAYYEAGAQIAHAVGAWV